LKPGTNALTVRHAHIVPLILANAGENAATKFLEFFAARIRNANTREAYARACSQFLSWSEQHVDDLRLITPMHVAAYIEQHLGSPQTIKQHLAAIKMLFDYLVISQIVPTNPAAPVKGPTYVVKRGKTPVLSVEDTRKLLDSIPTDSMQGLRDRALIGVMLFSFARISAVLGMQVSDFYENGRRRWFRLFEKGGKHHEVPVHHKAQDYVTEYLEKAGFRPNAPLFQTFRKKKPTGRAMSRSEAYRMIRRRAIDAGVSAPVSCHSFRATGITVYLENNGTLETAQKIAAHESPRTTKLYDRTDDQLTLDEIEKISV
jgi:integrase/recombinase XerD